MYQVMRIRFVNSIPRVNDDAFPEICISTSDGESCYTMTIKVMTLDVPKVFDLTFRIPNGDGYSLQVSRRFVFHNEEDIVIEFTPMIKVYSNNNRRNSYY